MQTEADRERILELGAKSAEVLGNSKFDESMSNHGELDWRKELDLRDGEPLVVVGSIRGEFEEKFVQIALKDLNARIVVAPRHIERAPHLLREFADSGLRSKGENHSRVVILDTFGELATIYPLATLAIIGGGFDKLGGQNFIQPLSTGCPVVCGPNMDNFREPFIEALESGALVVASTPEELRETVQRLLNDKSKCATMSDAGRRLVEKHKGASDRYASAILAMLPSEAATKTN
jgi:3-deoxy-D-manno-octulosonic-acid transferase